MASVSKGHGRLMTSIPCPEESDKRQDTTTESEIYEQNKVLDGDDRQLKVFAKIIKGLTGTNQLRQAARVGVGEVDLEALKEYGCDLG